jgi:hypothetical protein
MKLRMILNISASFYYYCTTGIDEKKEAQHSFEYSLSSGLRAY